MYLIGDIMIKKDLFNIVNRLKKIDKGYYVVFNKFKNRYEIFNKKQKKDTLAFCSDRPFLDRGIIIKAYKTNIRNAKNLFKEIDENNKKIDEINKNKINNKYLDKFSQFIDYASNKNYDVDFNNVDKTRWI